MSRDFTDVRDLVDAYLALLESESHSERVNIGSGSATPLRYLVETMNELAGYEIEVRVNPDFVRPNEIPRLQGDNRRLRTLTPWQPRIPLRETLADMLTHEQESWVETTTRPGCADAPFDGHWLLHLDLRELRLGRS